MRDPILVHIIVPSKIRFEIPFESDTTDQRILSELNAGKELFGRTGRVAAVGPAGSPTVAEDEKSPYIYDDPATRVVIIKPIPGVHLPGEVRTLKGPKDVPAPVA